MISLLTLLLLIINSFTFIQVHGEDEIGTTSPTMKVSNVGESSKHNTADQHGSVDGSISTKDHEADEMSRQF